jgi:hypothetical protein
LDDDFELDLHNNHRLDDDTSWLDLRAILHAT